MNRVENNIHAKFATGDCIETLVLRQLPQPENISIHFTVHVDPEVDCERKTYH